MPEKEYSTHLNKGNKTLKEENITSIFLKIIFKLKSF